VTPVASTVERVEQRVIRVDRSAKPAIMIDILRRETIDRALIFTRTKHGADKVVRGLNRSGIGAEAIHGNKSQSQRERVLAAFRKGEVRTLVATDIAARGIDVDGISHVVNFDMPNVPETYVHRIGRTARAGAEGIAISLCDREEMAFLRDIEKLIRMTIPASDRRSDQSRPEPRSATSGFINSRGNAKRRRGRGKAPAREQNRHGPANGPRSGPVSGPMSGSVNGPANEPLGIERVAFIADKDRTDRGRTPRPQRWAGHSQGS
jgi:superfamily II DNA/RNA helicase